MPRKTRSLQSAHRHRSYGATRPARRQRHRTVARQREIFGGSPAERVQAQDFAFPAATLAAYDYRVHLSDIELLDAVESKALPAQPG